MEKGYNWRSAAVHGSRFTGLKEEDASDVMIEAESIVRTCLSKILTDPKLSEKFSGPSREPYLDRLTTRARP